MNLAIETRLARRRTTTNWLESGLIVASLVIGLTFVISTGSVLRGMLLKPPPLYVEPQSIVTVGQVDRFGRGEHYPASFLGVIRKLERARSMAGSDSGESNPEASQCSDQRFTAPTHGAVCDVESFPSSRSQSIDGSNLHGG